MKAVHLPFVLACALPLFLILWSGCADMSTIPRDIDPAKASEMYKLNRTNPDFVVIDVRTDHEYEISHIPGASNIDIAQPNFRHEIDRLDRNKTYLLYCRSGNRSSQALDIMTEMGFKSIAHIAGGITAWEKSGLRTVVGPEPGR
jgi:rhodanese-related sulfurtransferase